MLTEPKLQRDVLEILLRLRRKPVSLVADIKEVFSQVFLTVKDLDPTELVDAYEAVRLIFGYRASPYLAQSLLRAVARS